jgi:hypothetical protein
MGRFVAGRFAAAAIVPSNRKIIDIVGLSQTQTVDELAVDLRLAQDEVSPHIDLEEIE